MRLYFMASPITFIANFINEYKKTNTEIIIDDFKRKLFENAIMSKYYEDENLLLLYHKYEIPSKSPLEKECRSLVVDMTDLNIISYTCQTPICNKEAQQFLLNNNDINLDGTIFKCYEGSILSLFNHNNKWYLSTRRCLDSNESNWNNTNHYNMFMDVLNSENTTFSEFTEKLNPEYGYYFVMMHHKNKLVVDYESQFGSDYSKLCLVFVRSKVDQIEIIDYDFPDYQNIFKAEEITIEEFSEQNNNLNISVNTEGIIIKPVKDSTPYLLKLQSNSYQFAKARGQNSNIFKGYLYLYQIGELKNYIENNSEHKNLDKIINPYNISESFDTVGVIDCVFKVLTSELFELYKLLWKLTNGEHQSLSLYNILPKEFKDVLYCLKGLYFKIKANPVKKLFGIKDIYEYLKTIDIEQLTALIRQRKLMFNWTLNNKTCENLAAFKNISNKCDKVHLKLIAIFTNKLFPDIMPTDIPNNLAIVVTEVTEEV